MRAIIAVLALLVATINVTGQSTPSGSSRVRRYVAGPDYSKGMTPIQLCATFEKNASVQCEIAAPATAEPNDFCLYGEYCLEQKSQASFLQLAAARPPLLPIGLRLSSRVFRPAQGVPVGQSYLAWYELRYGGPRSGRSSGLAPALGVAGQVLGNILRDGGWNSDGRSAQGQLDEFKLNLNSRISALTSQGMAKQNLLNTIMPALRNTFSLHSHHVRSLSPSMQSIASELSTAVVSAGTDARRTSSTLLDGSGVIRALVPQSARDQLKRSLPPGTLRPGRHGAGGPRDDVARDEYGSGDEMSQAITRESHKLMAVMTGPSRVLEHERRAAYAYAVAKLRLARSLSGRPVAERHIRLLIQDAQSARFFVQGAVKGVVEFRGGAGEITFSKDPRLFAGTIWATVAAEGTPGGMGNWGLPFVSLTFDDYPPARFAEGTVPLDAPALPGNASVDENITTTILYMRAEAFFSNDPDVLTNKTVPFSKFFWFADRVESGHEWDYKKQGSAYEYAGNFNYGATGAALGVSLEMLQRAAGFIQLRNGTSKPEWNSPFGDWPFGDDPDDQRAISDGYQYYLQHLSEWNKVRFGSPKQPR